MTSATLFREGTDLDTVLAGLDAEHPGQVHVVEVTYGRDGGMLGFFARRSVGVRYTLDGAADARPSVKHAAGPGPRHTESAPADSTLEDLLRAAEAAEMVESGRPVPRRATSAATATDDAPNVEFARMLLDIAAAKAAERHAAEEPADATVEAAVEAPVETPAEATVEAAVEAPVETPAETPAALVYDAIDAAIAGRAERLRAAAAPAVARAPSPPAAPVPPPPAPPVAWSAPRAPAAVWSAPPPRSPAPVRPAADDPDLIERLDIEVLVKRARTRPIGAHRVPPPDGAHSRSAVEGAHRVPALDGAHRVPPGEDAHRVPPTDDHYRVPPIEDAYRVPQPANGDRPAAPVGPAGRTPLTLRRQLAEMGVPVAWIPSDSADALWTIERVVELLPAAPRLDLGPGQLIVIAGPAVDAMRAAGQVCARLRMNPATVRAAGCPDGTVPPEQLITHRWEASNCASDIRRAHAAPAVIVVATDNQGVEAEDDWAGSMVAALAPDQLWLVLDATCKPADGRRLVDSIGAVSALVVNGSARTASPASVWDLQVPVALLDGRPATRGAWSVLLVDKLAALDA